MTKPCDHIFTPYSQDMGLSWRYKCPLCLLDVPHKELPNGATVDWSPPPSLLTLDILERVKRLEQLVLSNGKSRTGLTMMPCVHGGDERVEYR